MGRGGNRRRNSGGKNEPETEQKERGSPGGEGPQEADQHQAAGGAAVLALLQHFEHEFVAELRLPPRSPPPPLRLSNATSHVASLPMMERTGTVTLSHSCRGPRTQNISASDGPHGVLSVCLPMIERCQSPSVDHSRPHHDPILPYILHAVS